MVGGMKLETANLTPGHMRMEIEVIKMEENKKQDEEDDDQLDNSTKKVPDGYKIIDEVGQGIKQYKQTLWKVEHIATGNHYLIKHVRHEGRNGIAPGVYREICILKHLTRCGAPNIVKILHTITAKKRLFIVYENMSMHLKKYINRYPISDHQIQQIAGSILRGVDFYLTKGFLHRDIKPINLMVSERGEIKIAGFGLSTRMFYPTHPLSNEVQSLWYRAPEIVLGEKNYGWAIDAWSVGVIFAELRNKLELFRADSKIDLLFKIFQLKGTPNKERWPDAKRLPNHSDAFPRWRPLPLFAVLDNLPAPFVNLIERLTELDPKKRISPGEALKHRYFQTNLEDNISLLDSLC